MAPSVTVRSSGAEIARAEEGDSAGAASATSCSATTGSQGSVVFRSVLAGTYQVQTALPNDSYVASRVVATIVIPPNGVDGERFGFQQIGTVTGAIYDDADGDGVRRPGEGGMGGVVVVLIDAAGVELSRQVTAGDGSYRFGELAAGAYQLQLPQGSAGSYPITTTATGTLGASGQGGFTLTVEAADDGLYIYLPAIHNGIAFNVHLYIPEVYR